MESKRGKRVTSSDIAKMLGINQSTVSRALNNKSVSPDKRELILQTAQKLGYQPNGIARGLITGKSNMIGLITTDIKNPFYPDVIEKFAHSLRQQGLYVVFAVTESNSISYEDIEPFVELGTEGVISVATPFGDEVVQRLNEYGMPVVLFNRYTQAECLAVSCDNVLGGERVADFLISMNHRQYGFVAGDREASTSRDRENGFRKRLAEAGFGAPAVVNGQYTYEGGYKAGIAMLSSHDAPDAVFCANDIMALGFIDAARFLGKHVPSDVSVVGFDDITLASWKAYSLTTIQQPVDKMIDRTIDKILNTANSSIHMHAVEFIPGELIIRTSVADRR